MSSSNLKTVLQNLDAAVLKGDVLQPVNGLRQTEEFCDARFKKRDLDFILFELQFVHRHRAGRCNPCAASMVRTL